MNPDLEKNLTRLRKVSKDLKRGTLSELDKEWLADCLWKIYEGAKPELVLGIEAGRGQRRGAIDQNHQIDHAMHFVAGLIDKEMGAGLRLNEAIKMAAKFFIVKPATLTRYWHDPTKAHLRSVVRNQETYD